MLLSMTGFGEARLQDDRWIVGVEVRTVDNRHLTLSAGTATSGTDYKPWAAKTLTFKAGTFQKVITVTIPSGAIFTKASAS